MLIKNLSQCVSIDEEDVKSYICDHYPPHEIYSFEDLEEWAINNGFVKRQDDE